jgi:hypothetical protein
MWAVHKPFATLFSSTVVPVLGHDGYAGASVISRAALKKINLFKPALSSGMIVQV